ncbi:MAG: alpha/beta hydrolase family protein, partial [Planctomycetota bacterium]
MVSRSLGATWSLCTLLLLVSSGCTLLSQDSNVIRPSKSLPATTPWDLVVLSEPPDYEWSDSDNPVRALYYSGEPYKGKPTRVFAYYASPATLDGTSPADTTFPAVVLVHGGGGTAFSQWAELWAKRGYAAIAMDLAGCGPERKRLDD